MNINGCFLIHFKSRVTVRKNRVLVFDGNHIFFYHDAVVVPAVNFNIVGTQVDTECIVCQMNNPFLQVTLFLEADIFVISDYNMVYKRNIQFHAHFVNGLRH